MPEPTALPSYAVPAKVLLEKLRSSNDGLSAEEVTTRLVQYGPNTLPEGQHVHILKIFLAQFLNIMMALMGVAAALSLIMGHVFDATLIVIILIINGVLGFVQEYRAERSIQALKKMLVIKAKVRRGGEVMEIPQEQLVPGDILLLEEGNQVPADARLLEVHRFAVSESSLTGESLPAEKKVEQLPAETVLGDRVNMIWMGTTVTQGTAVALVVATGSQTEFGLIATALSQVSSEPEHFQEKVDVLSKQMAVVAVVTAALTFLVGYLFRGFSIQEISLYTIATLVSALPEGLPIILVIILAVAAQRMAKQKAIVRKLSATETLGIVSIIMTDKTGTLTQNSMSARVVQLPGQAAIQIEEHPLDETKEQLFYQEKEPLSLHENPQLKDLIIILGVSHQVQVSTKYSAEEPKLLGDPTEKALVSLALRAGFQTLPQEESPEVLDDLPFQSEAKLRATLVQKNGKKHVYLIGAPEAILARSQRVMWNGKEHELTPERHKELEKSTHPLVHQGMRVIGVASCVFEGDAKSLDLTNLPDCCVFMGYVALHDPPRPEVAKAIATAKTAGIRVIMATGDHPLTALAVAKQVGMLPETATEEMTLSEKQIRAMSDDELQLALDKVTVLARLSPDSKMRVAGLLQKAGHVVAMTGDGINDAPALKKADVGIAMGITGTDVARQASKIVLADDNFASIVSAVREGRTQFNNLRRTSYFLIITNVAESAALLLALGLGFPLPLLPTQILWLNVVTGGTTDFSLALEPSHRDVMLQPPRSPKEQILSAWVLPMIGVMTTLMTIIGVAVFSFYLRENVDKARTALFVVFSFSQLLNMFNLRSMKRSVFELGLFSNKAAVITFFAGIGLLMLALNQPQIRQALHFQNLRWTELLVLAGISSVVFLITEITKKTFLRRRLANIY